MRDLEDNEFRVKIPVEDGARGLVGKSAYTFITEIGLSSRERTKAMIKSDGGQSKLSQDCDATEGVFLARGLFTTLQEKLTSSEERHWRGPMCWIWEMRDRKRC